MGLVLDDIQMGTLLLSPMAGITDSVFRRLCRRMGAGAVYTEFVSSDGVIRSNRRTYQLASFQPEEHPVGIQLFGGNPEILADAARRMWELGPDLIDINFGCPVRKVVKKSAGSAVLQDLGLYREIIASVVDSVPGPVTVKIRAGWDESSLVYPEAAGIAAEEGVRAITLHPRTRAQGYSGKADWDRISHLVRESPIPVIGNGDLFEPEDVRRMMEETGCQAVMIARGAIGNPWIFSRTKTLLETGLNPPPPLPEEKLEAALLHCRLEVENKGEKRGLQEVRKHLAYYTRGLWCGAKLRQALFQTVHYLEIEGIIREYLDALSRYAAGEPSHFEPGLDAKRRTKEELRGA